MLPTTPYRIRLGVSGFRSQYLVLAKHARFRLRQYPLKPMGTRAGPLRRTAPRKQKNQKVTYSTWDSHVVPYRSTDQAQRCLTSQFGWDTVLSPWYDRMTMSWRRSCTSVWKKHKFQKKSCEGHCSSFYFVLFSRPGHCGPFISSHQRFTKS